MFGPGHPEVVGYAELYTCTDLNCTAGLVVECVLSWSHKVVGYVELYTCTDLNCTAGLVVECV